MELENKAKRGVEDDDGEDWGQLLEDLLFEEVLPRLPVRSLIRLKLVSKKWLHHITKDSHFICNHIRRQSQATELTLIPARSTQPPSKRVFIMDRRTNKARLIDSSVARDFPYHRVIGSCDGLVCISLWMRLVRHKTHTEAVVLWNPETGEMRDTVVAPPVPCSFDEQWKGCFVYPAYGFGPGERRGDYKVIRISLSQPTTLNFDVFSVNSGVWRRLEKSLCGYTVYQESFESVLVNGCLYWLVWKVDEGFSTVRRRSVLSFDLRDDEFRIVRIFKDDMNNSKPCFYPYPSRLIKWKGNCLAYFKINAHIGSRRDFTVETIVDNNGNVVNDTSTCSSTLDFSLSEQKPSSFGNSILWQVAAVSHCRFFVAEGDDRLELFPEKLPLNPDGTRQEVWSSRCFQFGAVHDYVPTLVSVYPNLRDDDRRE